MFVHVCSSRWYLTDVLNGKRHGHGLQPTARAMAKLPFTAICQDCGGADRGGRGGDEERGQDNRAAAVGGAGGP